jgi:DNA-directed RNA polymerase subunit K/omega
MPDQRVYLDDIYSNEQCQGSVFRAVVMMAHEARFINKQAGQGFIQLTKKPTTIAMYKFKEGKLSMTEKTSNDVSAEAVSAAAAFAPEAENASPVTEISPDVSAQADDAFGM